MIEEMGKGQQESKHLQQQQKMFCCCCRCFSSSSVTLQAEEVDQYEDITVLAEEIIEEMLSELALQTVAGPQHEED